MKTLAPPEEIRQLADAAKTAVARGWSIFAAPYRTKSAFKDSRGSLDAATGEAALEPWKVHSDANPMIRLDRSNLTVIDVDKGVPGRGHLAAWMEARGLPATYIVTTGRAGGGFHLYYAGVRTLPDSDFAIDGVTGQLKCHGAVVAEGGLHKTGATYTGNQQPIAPLPEFIRDYQLPAKKGRIVHKSDDGAGEKIPEGQRNKHLVKRAGQLRQAFGLGEEALYHALRDICCNECVDGENYIEDQDGAIRRIARSIAAKTQTPTRKQMQQMRGVRITKVETPREKIAASLRREFPEGHRPITYENLAALVKESFPDVPEMTVRRAIGDVFEKAGTDSGDKRRVLWVRKIENRSDINFALTC